MSKNNVKIGGGEFENPFERRATATMNTNSGAQNGSKTSTSYSLNDAHEDLSSGGKRRRRRRKSGKKSRKSRRKARKSRRKGRKSRRRTRKRRRR